jgi:hypothetical protein
VLDGVCHGWAQARVYNRGLHVITLTTEGDAALTVRAEFNVTISATPANVFASLQLVPVATNVQVDVRDFKLTKFGELHGDLSRELGHGLKRIIEHELDGQKLALKVNRAIQKKLARRGAE